MLDDIRKEIRRMMNDLADDISTGVCEDFNQYRFMVGKIEGLAEAERMLIDRLARLDIQDDA